MKLIKLFFILMIVFTDFAMCTNVALIPRNKQEDSDDRHDNYGELLVHQDHDDQESSSSSDPMYQVERFFSRKKRTHRRPTCKKFPRICHAKGSPGPSCCKKKCVDLLRDRHNCGKCGKKCKYNRICCNGKCVNPSFNKKHCGGCNNRCSNGGLCAFGLCNYA
ncbi:Stigma-specific protein [Parasponia andersonii]|uniref:Stigma-specific protein n=1 Tax=Parasponia andersonii TaxID=3476 RepID=A0A2P5CNV7_PARAD|nr:Stigma-specific protein [Parasponia andersonii]